ncbi:MAG: Patatin [Bacteroidetes bacterium]|nr:Patatin [Bacteroidota bacterium]
MEATKQQSLTAKASKSNQEIFTNQPEVQACLKQLRERFNDANPLVVSDVMDKEKHQYVNLVQKGGGVLGVALVGYTYILEEMGIRFLRLAGTSAGAINTSLMVVVGKKEEAKSKRIIDIMSTLDFFSLVDGHPAARMFIRNFITHKNYANKLKWRLILIFSLLLLLFVSDFVFSGLEHNHPNLAPFTHISFILTGFVLVFVGALGFYLNRLSRRLKNAGFGINPGDYFYDWLKGIFIENGVKTVKDLNDKAEQPIPGMCLRVEHTEGTAGLKSDVKFITSELVTENKVLFPEMCKLFREEDKMDLQPAGFVRASMSIPLFFESYFINNIPVESEAIKKAWKETFSVDTPPTAVRFVDGGLLSNFPINLFYNPSISVPRLPTFGIDLDDTVPEDHKNDTVAWSFLGYFGRMLTTLRGFYDKDFLVQNKVYERGIGAIPLADFNWLNFFLTDEDKKTMFVRGAEAATKFLLDFNWEEYKALQAKMRKEIKKEQKPLTYES